MRCLVLADRILQRSELGTEQCGSLARFHASICPVWRRVASECPVPYLRRETQPFESNSAMAYAEWECSNVWKQTFRERVDRYPCAVRNRFYKNLILKWPLVSIRTRCYDITLHRSSRTEYTNTHARCPVATSARVQTRWIGYVISSRFLTRRLGQYGFRLSFIIPPILHIHSSSSGGPVKSCSSRRNKE
jgi:hypothetical protein